jgi:hypothetical protein
LDVVSSHHLHFTQIPSQERVNEETELSEGFTLPSTLTPYSIKFLEEKQEDYASRGSST